MKIDPSNNPINLNSQSDSVTKSSAQTDSAKGSEESKSQLALSKQTKQLQEIQERLINQNSVDSKRVEEVKNKLKDLEIDLANPGPNLDKISQRIADKMIEMDEFLSNK